MLVSPYEMRERVNKMLDVEIRNAKKGEEAFFYGKFNSITDEAIIERLYKASRAGVRIRLIVRGACCLQPQVPGLSDNIEVHSIVDKYLEHARMMICCNGGNHKSYILSADLMTRNLDRRVEAGMPVMDREIHGTLADIFEIQWKDNTKSRILNTFDENKYVECGEEEPLQSQTAIYDYFKREK